VVCWCVDYVFCFFFFSSRRRHTRWPRDWSSDVCSSDLVEGGTEMSPGGEMRGRLGIEGPFGGGKYFRGALVYTTTGGNDLGTGRESGIGDRILAYAAVSMPAGSSHLSLYGWEMRRLRARNVDTSTVAVPRG